MRSASRDTPAPHGLSWHRARAIAYDVAPVLDSRPVPLTEALGRPLAQDLTARGDLPHYGSSAMDGWAVAGDGPWRLCPSRHASHPQEIHRPGSALHLGHAAPIVTGGAVPDGATAVLRSEHGRVQPEFDGAELLVDAGPAPVPPGAHIRPAGEEARAGEVLIPAGEVLTPAHLAVAAVAGTDTLTVWPRPAVTALLTGDEVVTAGTPGPGQVRDAFGPQLPTVIELLGGRTTAVHRLADDRAAVMRALTEAAADVVVTTGGTGRSTADHVRAGLIDLGAELFVDGIDVRPGHPAVLARLPGGPLVVALPGNPLAAMLTLLTLAEPVLAGLLGRRRPATVLARSAADLPPGRTTRLVPARRESGSDGFVPSEHTGAGMLRGLADADVVLVVPARGLIAWREAEALPLPWQRQRIDDDGFNARGDTGDGQRVDTEGVQRGRADAGVRRAADVPRADRIEGPRL